MQNDGVATTPKVYGVKGRRIRALALNERQLKVAEAAQVDNDKKLKKANEVLERFESDPLAYNNKLYKEAISNKDIIIRQDNIITSRINRLRKEIITLKTRI